MKAKLLDLDGKYYGTEVEISDNNDKSLGVIKIWIHNGKASTREYDTEEELNEMYNDGLFCDEHYETETDLKIADILVNAINNSK